MLENMKDDFWAAGPEGQTSWFGRADDEELVSSNYRMAVISLDEFLKNNPKATEKDVTTFLDNLKKDVNNTECDKLVDFWASRNRIGKTADTAKEKNIKKGDVVDGYEFLGGDPKSKRNWKKI